MGLFTTPGLSSTLIGPVQFPQSPVPGPGPGPGPGPTPAKTIYEYPGWTRPPVAVAPLTPTISSVPNAPKPVVATTPKVEPKNSATPTMSLPALLASLPVASLGSGSDGAAGSNPNPMTAEPTLTWLSNHKGMVAGAAAALGVAFYLVLKK